MSVTTIGDATLYLGDCRDVLATLPDQSVQTCITSPPYFGLRDYGVEGQIGLEATPAEFVAQMVAVFREVRRVLRDDGTLWLNLGSSYASGGTSPNQSRGPSRAPAYGSDGIGPADSLATGSAYSDLCDECRAATSSRTSGTGRRFRGGASQPLREGRDSGPADSAPGLPAASLPGAQASTSERSDARLPGACSHCGNCGACLAVLGSSSRDGSLCGRRVSYTTGTDPLESVGRNRGMDALGTAWLNYNPKPKDLVPIPWLVALALRADGWYLRQDIIWSKPNPMPESVRDRCTKSHEYLFLLAKSERYYFDSEAIAEPLASSSIERLTRSGLPNQAGSDRVPGKTNGPMKAVSKYLGDDGAIIAEHQTKKGLMGEGNKAAMARSFEKGTRNRRTVWTVPTHPFSGAHFATFPPDLIRPCVLAGAPPGGVVLDPFNGAGTTGMVALQEGRRYIGIELNPEYLHEIAAPRIRAAAAQPRLFA